MNDKLRLIKLNFAKMYLKDFFTLKFLETH